MPRYGVKRTHKIEQMILNLLADGKERFSKEISDSIDRDDSYIIRLLKNMNEEGLIYCIDQNKHGQRYLRRRKWKINENALARLLPVSNEEVLSNCCSARIEDDSDFCSECGEHCGVMQDDS